MSSRTRATKASATAATATAPAATKAAAASKRTATTAAAAAPAKPAARATTARAKKAAAVVEESSEESSEEEEEESSEEEEAVVVAVKKTKKQPARVVAAASSSDSDSEEVAESSSSSSEEEEFKPTKKGKAAAAAPKKRAEKEAAAAPAKRAAAKKAAASVVPLSTSPAAAAASSPALALHAQLGALLAEAQHSYHRHGPLVSQASSLLSKSPDAFLDSFVAHAAFVCARPGAASGARKVATVQRVLEWMGALVSQAFSSQQGASLRFAEEVLQQLLQWSGAKDKNVRARACSLFYEIFSRLDEEAEVPEYLFERASSLLIKAASSDRIEAVRAEAARAMHRLQADSSDGGGAGGGANNCPVLACYIRLIRWDPSALVRRTAVEHVAPLLGSPEALRALLDRTADVDAMVRAAAFRTLGHKVHMKQLRIEERARLIRQGFVDRSPEVQRAARELVLGQWLASTKEGDVVRLLKSVAVETFPEEAAAVVVAAVRAGWHKKQLQLQQSQQQGKVGLQPPYAPEELTPERALYWRVLLETLSGDLDQARRGNRVGSLALAEAEAVLDALKPDTVELCQSLRAHAADPFIVAQLAAISLLALDPADEAGRRELGNWVESMLRDITSSQQNVPVLMKVYRLVHSEGGASASNGGLAPHHHPSQVNLDNENSFIRVVLELLSDIRDPLEHGGGDGADGDHDGDEAQAQQKSKVDLEQRRSELNARYEELRAHIDRAQVQKQAAINAENYVAAENIKTQLSALCEELDTVERELNSAGFQDAATWARLLTIVCDLLEQTRRSELGGNGAAAGRVVSDDGGLGGLLSTTIWPGIRSDHPQVQSLGLKSLALYALLDRPTARGSLPMFLAAATQADTMVQRATAMRAVTDLLMMYEDLLAPEPKKEKKKKTPVAAAAVDGAAEEAKEQADESAPAEEADEEDEEEEEDGSASLLSDVQSLFVHHLSVAAEQPTDASLVEVCVMGVECLAKLLLFDRLPLSTELLSIMLFLFFHPGTDTRTTQCLAVFLPAFMLVNPTEHVGAYLHALLPAVRLLSTAQSAAAHSSDDEEGTWKGFNILSAWKVMVSFLPPAAAAPGTTTTTYTPSQTLAIEVAHQLLAFPEAALSAMMVQGLAALTLTPLQRAAAAGDAVAVEAGAAVPPPPFHLALQHLLRQVGDSLRDKVALKELTKFVTKFNKTINEALGEEEGEEELSEAALDLVEHQAAERVAELQEQQEAEQAMLAASEEASAAADDMAAAKPAKAKARAAPSRGKRALKPKTPAKKSRKEEASDDDDDDNDDDSASEQGSSDDDDEEDGGAAFRISKAAGKGKAKAAVPAASAARSRVPPAAAPAPVESARPSRASKVQAQAKMEKAHSKQVDVDKILDEESEEEEAEEEEEEEEEEDDSDSDDDSTQPEEEPKASVRRSTRSSS